MDASIDRLQYSESHLQPIAYVSRILQRSAVPNPAFRIPIPVSSILITAFEPYDRWQENSSWLALVELTRELPLEPKVVTRRYPVDFEQTRSRLFEDLAAGYDFALHLGQAPGIGRIHLEAIGVNVGGHSSLLP